MKEKITSILRHFFTGAAAIAVDAGLIDKAEADSIVRLTAAALAIVVSRLIIWGLGKIDFIKFFPALDNFTKGGGTNLLLLSLAYCGMAFGLGVSLTSCGSALSPSAYDVDTENYSEQIASNPGSVIFQAEDVRPIGGFQFKAGARVLTDAGEINLSESGVSGDVVVDLRSGK